MKTRTTLKDSVFLKKGPMDGDVIYKDCLSEDNVYVYERRRKGVLVGFEMFEVRIKGTSMKKRTKSQLYQGEKVQDDEVFAAVQMLLEANLEIAQKKKVNNAWEPSSNDARIEYDALKSAWERRARMEVVRIIRSIYRKHLPVLLNLSSGSKFVWSKRIV